MSLAVIILIVSVCVIALVAAFYYGLTIHFPKLTKSKGNKITEEN